VKSILVVINVKALPNVVITAWRIMLDKIPTRRNLIRRGLTVNTSTCVMCQATDESAQYLFIQCETAQKVWYLCLRWIGIQFVQHKDVICLFEHFHLLHISSMQNLIWKGIWAAVVRSIWD